MSHKHKLHTCNTENKYIKMYASKYLKKIIWDSISGCFVSKIFMGGGMPPDPPIEGLCFALRMVCFAHPSSHPWPCNSANGQSNQLLIGHFVRASLYCTLFTVAIKIDFHACMCKARMCFIDFQILTKSRLILITLQSRKNYLIT